MARVPSIDPKREREIARLQKLLDELERIPSHRREDECADVRAETVISMLLDLAPPTYQWSTRDDDIAEDAIIVGIGGASASMIAAGLSYTEPTASIYWCARVTAKGIFDVGTDPGPLSVSAALRRAQLLKSRMGYDRVVVTMEEAGIWRPEWGRLAYREGY